MCKYSDFTADDYRESRKLEFDSLTYSWKERQAAAAPEEQG